MLTQEMAKARMSSASEPRIANKTSSVERQFLMTEILPSNHRQNPSGAPVQHVGVPIEDHTARKEIRDMFHRWGITGNAAKLALSVLPPTDTMAQVLTEAEVLAS